MRKLTELLLRPRVAWIVAVSLSALSTAHIGHRHFWEHLLVGLLAAFAGQGSDAFTSSRRNRKLRDEWHRRGGFKADW